MADSAPRHWHLGSYRIDYWRGRWGLSDGHRASWPHRTPLTAWLALRRYQRTA